MFQRGLNARLDPMIRQNPKRPWTEIIGHLSSAGKKEFLSQCRNKKIKKGPRRHQEGIKMTGAESKSRFTRNCRGTMPSPLQSKWLCWASLIPSGSWNHLVTKVFRVATISPILSHCICVALQISHRLQQMFQGLQKKALFSWERYGMFDPRVA